jgi:hypothetical protein
VFGASDVNYAFYTQDSRNPAVACIPTSPTNAKCAVVWELLYGAGDHEIYGQMINEDGTHAGAFTPSNTTFDETSAAIAANEDAQEYLVVWHSSEGIMDNPIKGVIYNSLGQVKTNILTISGVAADYPAVSPGLTGDFLAVWQDQPISLTHEELYGQLFGSRQFVPLIVR